MYTDIDCEYTLSTTFNLTLNCPLILKHACRSDPFFICLGANGAVQSGEPEVVLQIEEGV